MNQMETFTLQLDQLLRGETISGETPDLAFARRLHAVDLSPRSQVYHALRARLFTAENFRSISRTTASPTNSHPLIIQRRNHWRTSLMSRFNLLKPTLAFVAAMVLLVLFLVWVLTNTTPQPAVVPSPAPLISSSPSPLPVETMTGDLPVIPASNTLPGDLFFLIRPTSPPFYYQWAYMPAFCLGDRVDCDLQMLPGLPDGEAIPDTALSWSPDGTKAIFFNSHSTTPTLYELSAMTGKWRAIPVDFWVVKAEYFWAFTSRWVAFQAQGEGDHTSYIRFFNPETNEFRESNEVPGEERIPVFWLREDELIVQILRYVPNGSGNNPVGRYVLLNVQTGQETEYNGFEAMGVVSPTTTWGSDDVLSPDYLWWASPRSKGLQTEIVLMRGDGSENHSIFKADGRLNGPVIWLNNNYLFVRLYNQQVDRNNLYLISLTDNTAQEIFLPDLDTSAFDVAQVSFRPIADPPFGGASVGQFPSPTPYPTHAPTTGDPLTVLQTLTTQYANDILSGSGWLHLRTWQFVNDEPGTLPNGALMPNPAIWDDWYQFDDQLQVLYEVSLYMDENGNVNQASIQRDGQSYNLTLAFSDTPSPFNPNFDLDFTERAANLIAEGETLNMSDFSIDGQYSGLMFSIRQGDTEWEAVFNPDTGALLSYTVYQLAAGGKTIQNVMTMLVQEWVAEPPADILAYLDQELKPYAPLPPIGTPAPEGFDASFSDLTFKWIYGDDVNAPTFFYMDVYAEDYLLGRFDSGGTPGGWCDRSFDGAYIAFNYQRPEPDYLTTLRWFHVNEISNVLEPFPALQQNSPPSFAPQDLRMAFGACEAGNCGYYIYNLQTGELTKITDGPAYASPAWTPDGNYLVYLIPAGSENTDLKQGEVIRADTGEVVFTGTTNEILQKYGVTVPAGASGLSCERAPDTSPDTQPVLNPDGTYTVQDGDTLVKIASDFGLTVEVLLALNGMTPASPLIIGQILVVVPPDPSNLQFPAQATVTVPAYESVNLRSGPGTQFEVLGTLTGGTPVRVLDANEGFDWYEIAYEESATGTAWVYGPWLTFQVQSASGSIPTNTTVNPALSTLSFKYVFNPDGSAPDIYLADVYAGDMYVGRTDFGEIPGGLCARSWNGVLLAFTYAKSGANTLRWVSLKDVTMYNEVPGYTLHSPVTFAPNDFRLTFVGCKEEDCGIFVKDLETNSAVIKLSDGDTYAHPAWSPDGQYIIIWYGEPINERGITNIKVVHAETGEELYMGDPTLDGSPLQAWHISPMYRPMTSTGRCEAAPDNLQASATLSPDGTYTVQEGDTLAGIANHFGVAIEILLSFNGLSSDTALYVGQVLIVFPPLTNP